MTSSNSSPRRFDFASIRYPSDRISVADIRRAHPAYFDGDDAGGFANLSHSTGKFTLDAIFYVERTLAEAAFERAKGTWDAAREAELDRDSLVKDLTTYYKTYGVATGRKLTEQLVRDIETQAAAQAGLTR